MGFKEFSRGGIEVLQFEVVGAESESVAVHIRKSGPWPVFLAPPDAVLGKPARGRTHIGEKKNFVRENCRVL